MERETVSNWFENDRVPRHRVGSLIRDRHPKGMQNFPMHASEDHPRAARKTRQVATLLAVLHASCAPEKLA
jgi:hypothetical protein